MSSSVNKGKKSLNGLNFPWTQNLFRCLKFSSEVDCSFDSFRLSSACFGVSLIQLKCSFANFQLQEKYSHAVYYKTRRTEEVQYFALGGWFFSHFYQPSTLLIELKLVGSPQGFFISGAGCYRTYEKFWSVFLNTVVSALRSLISVGNKRNLIELISWICAVKSRVIWNSVINLH